MSVGPPPAPSSASSGAIVVARRRSSGGVGLRATPAARRARCRCARRRSTCSARTRPPSGSPARRRGRGGSRSRAASGWLASSSVRLFDDSTNANVRGVGSSAPGTTIGGDSVMPSGTEPNERIVLSVGLSSLGGSVRSNDRELVRVAEEARRRRGRPPRSTRRPCCCRARPRCDRTASRSRTRSAARRGARCRSTQNIGG